MFDQRRSRVTAVRARHKKRIPDPAPQLTGPFTFTFTTTRNAPTTPTSSPVIPPPPPPPPTSTTTITTPAIPPTTAPLPPPSPPPTTQVTPPVNTATQPTVPIIQPQVSVNSQSSLPTNSTNAPVQAGALSDSVKLPAGAIVGIAVGAILVLLAVVVLIARSRFRKNRQTRRATWLARGGIASTDGNVVTGKTLSSFAPQERQPVTAPAMSTYPSYSTLRGETSPGLTFAQQQTRALSAVPMLTPPAASYNNPSAASYATSPAGPTPGSTAITPRALLPTEAATVKFTFIPSLPDELSISNGEVVKVLQEFDDGWALCVNSRGLQGMVPLECLDRQEGMLNSAARNSNRASSLNILPNRRSSGVF